MADLEATQPTQAHGRSRGPGGRPLGNPPPVLFVGGTGRSGTHVLAKLLSRHPRLAMFPIEVRFHVEEMKCPWCRATLDDLERAEREGDLDALLERVRMSTQRYLRSRTQR